jgi:DNA processing protein
LCEPVTERERGILVSLSIAGLGPARLVRAVERVEAIKDLSDEHPARTRAFLKRLEKLGARAVVPSDDEYPDELAHIDAAPPLLFVRGDRIDCMRPFVAIVGARACTTGASRFAERLGEAFAYAGFGVVSGLARGIDGAAHRGALESGRTVAVLGTGIDICYPAEHRELAGRIMDAGALVSEFPPGVGPRAWHFPARNRIIAGLCAALVVVEAGHGSGALITAGFALDAGREVLACTTGPENPAGSGVREMLKDGATLVVDAEQAVQAVNDVLGAQHFLYGRPEPRPDPADVLTGDRRAVYEAVPDDAGIDDVVRASALDGSRVATILSALELDGLLEFADGRWRRASNRRW